jgi:hypothetical protein
MRHIIKITQTGNYFDVKYRRKCFRYRTAKEAKDKADNILFCLFFSGIPFNLVEYRDLSIINQTY